jgi:hypothetical protein
VRSRSEVELADAWEDGTYQVQDGWLSDTSGGRWKVVFPGRRWGGPGPDFRGALLALQTGQLVHGDVEIHRRGRDWTSHGHATDPAYAHVILHVVEQPDGPTRDAHGRAIPTLVLDLDRGPPSMPAALSPPARRSPRTSRVEARAAPATAAATAASAQATDHAAQATDQAAPGRWALARGASRPVLVPCQRAPSRVLQVVEDAADARMMARAARFEGDLAVTDADQVLWRGIAEALGFAHNAQPFGLLADAVPWSEAAPIVSERGPVALAGLLLGMAGLIAHATLPEAHAWRALQRERGLRVLLSRSTWYRRGLRAGNAPAERCRGLAELAARWSAPCAAAAGGPAQFALHGVCSAARVRHPQLWPFACASPWVGRGRAQVVAINVLLPFACAAGHATEASAVFERIAGEPTNRAVRYMAGMLAAPGVRFRGARHQQGLLHLFKSSCAVRRCETCPALGMDAAQLPLEIWP